VVFVEIEVNENLETVVVDKRLSRLGACGLATPLPLRVKLCDGFLPSSRTLFHGVGLTDNDVFEFATTAVMLLREEKYLRCQNAAATRPPPHSGSRMPILARDHSLFAEARAARMSYVHDGPRLSQAFGL
jgi:hypothetical protein